MSNDKFALALEALQATALLAGEGSVQALDLALSKVTEHHDARSIGPLLLLLNDQAEYEEGMFSLIHAAEAFDDQTYVREFLEVLPQLRSSSPKWASIVLMRALNNDGTRATLVRALRDATPSAKAAAKWLCERINEQSSKFTAKTLPVLLAVTA